jgi:hypothetical protein
MDFLTLLSRVSTRLRMRALPAALAALFMAAPGAVFAAEGESLEYAVKAAYLYKFGIYAEWPAGAFSSPSAPLNLCVVGEDPFGAALDSAVSGQRIDTHPIVVRRMKTVGRDAGCHILYLGVADAARIGQIAEMLRGSGVLTVGDARAAGGGIITFVVKDNRVRFNIDEDAAAQNGLAISSKLLSLALNVKPKQVKGER